MNDPYLQKDTRSHQSKHMKTVIQAKGDGNMLQNMMKNRGAKRALSLFLVLSTISLREKTVMMLCVKPMVLNLRTQWIWILDLSMTPSVRRKLTL